METTFFRYLNKKEGQKDHIYNNTFFVVAFTSLLFLLTSLIFIKPFAIWMQAGRSTSLADYTIYIKYFIVILVIDALSVVPFAKLRAEGKPSRYSLIKLINVLTFIGLNLVFIFLIPFLIKYDLLIADSLQKWYQPQWVGYVFVSNLIASSITFLLLMPELLQLKIRIDRSLIAEMLSYSWPVLVANLSFIINENIDKIFLGHLLPSAISEAQVGIYGACCKIAIFLSIFIMAFRLGAEPFFFNHAKNENAGKTYATIMNYFILAVCLIFVGIVANIELLKHFIEERYWVGLNVVPILLFGYVSLGIYMNLSIWYKLSDQTKFGLLISGVGALLTIILNLIFIPKYGYLASAWISLIAYSSMMILSYVLGQKHYPIPYTLKRNIGYLSLSIIIVMLSFVVFDRNIIIGNLLFISFSLLIIYLERKQLRKIFASL
jgi:O-antigen/teichoic acid export membrane protein